MNWQHRLGEGKRAALGGAAATAMAGLLASFSQGLSERSYDWLFRFRPPVDVSADNAVIVDMDDESASAQHLGQPSLRTWDRALHAHLIETLSGLRAEVIVFDVFFRDADPNRLASDREVLNAAAAHGKVLFPAIDEFEMAPDGRVVGTRIHRSFDWLTKLDNVGVTEETHAAGLIIRRHQPGILRVPSLAWKAAELSMAEPPAEPSAPRWVNYYGPPGYIPHVSYFRVLSNTVPPSIQFSNRVVFVGGRTTYGPTAGSGTDYFPTPYPGAASGVEINATTYLNLWRRDWLTRWPPVAERLLLAALGLIGGWMLSKCSPMRAAVWGGAAAAGAFVVAVTCFWSAHFWFPWLIIVVVQAPVAVGWSALAHTSPLTQEKALREDEPATTAAGTEAVPAGDAKTVVVPAAASVRTADWISAIPDHAVLRRVGKGAYGEVWLARNAIGTYHAVKIIRREDFVEAEPFEREFRGLQKFMPISHGHPGLVLILHVGRHDRDGFIFYIMEAADDENTGARIDPDAYSPKNLAKEIRKRGHLPAAECVQLGLDLTAALEFLHQQKLIHRDIKPANIIFVKGAPKFADIGLVTDIARTGEAVTQLGTEGYIPPEGPGTPAADVFSLGKVLYEASMGMGCQKFPELPSTLAGRPDQIEFLRLNKVLLKACRQDPSLRYRTAAELREDLLALQA